MGHRCQRITRLCSEVSQHWELHFRIILNTSPGYLQSRF